VDPIYFEKTYYLGPDKGGEKAYRLLADAMAKTTAWRCRSSSCAARRASSSCDRRRTGSCCTRCTSPTRSATSARSTRGSPAKIRDGELELAERLVDELSHDGVQAAQYEDDYRVRVLDLVNAKVEGKEGHRCRSGSRQRAQVIDLMDALKQNSLARRSASDDEARAKKPPSRSSRRRRGEVPEGPRRKE
jgi:DNA end-binding protein Ku